MFFSSCYSIFCYSYSYINLGCKDNRFFYQGKKLTQDSCFFLFQSPQIFPFRYPHYQDTGKMFPGKKIEIPAGKITLYQVSIDAFP